MSQVPTKSRWNTTASWWTAEKKGMFPCTTSSSLANTSPTDNVFGPLFPAPPVSCSNYWCSSSHWSIIHVSSNFVWQYLQIMCTCPQLSIFNESTLSIILQWLWHSSIWCILVQVIKLLTCSVLLQWTQQTTFQTTTLDLDTGTSSRGNSTADTMFTLSTCHKPPYATTVPTPASSTK